VREFVLVVESDPNLAPPGIRRRYEHVTSWLQEHGVHFRTVTLLPRPDLGRWARLVGVVGARKRILTDLSPDATIMVLGLGAPHMLMAAHSCLGAGRSVVYDVCDSWLLQFKARMWSGKLVRVLSRFNCQAAAHCTGRTSPIAICRRMRDLTGDERVAS
jgi:hypothetical protein